MTKSAYRTFGLPAVFYAKNSAINRPLIEKLLALVPDKALLAKLLRKKYQRVRPENEEDLLALTIKYLPDPNFRAIWNETASSKKARTRRWETLFHLVADYIKSTSPGLELAAIARNIKIRPLIAPNKTHYLDPNRLDAICKYFSEETRDPSLGALLIWSFAEAAEWNGFEKAKLTSKKLNELSTQFDSSNFDFGSEVCRLLEIPAPPVQTQTQEDMQLNSVQTNGSLKEDTSPPFGYTQDARKSIRPPKEETFPLAIPQHPALMKTKAVFQFTKESWVEYLEALRLAKLSTTRLSVNPGHDLFIESWSESTDLLKAKLKAFTQNVKRLKDSCVQTTLALQKDYLSREIIVDAKSEYSSMRVKDWDSVIDDRLSKLEKLEQALIRFDSARKDLESVKHVVSPLQSLGTVQELTEELVSYTKNARQVVCQVRKLDQARLRIREIAERGDQICEVISPDDTNFWRVFLSDTRLEEIDPFVIGFALRCSLEGEELVDWNPYDFLLKLCGSGVDTAIETLSVLGRQEVERLWEKEESWQELLAITLLNSCFTATEFDSNGAMDFWYWKPLQGFTRKIAPTSTSPFGKEGFYILSAVYKLMSVGKIENTEALVKVVNIANSASNILACDASDRLKKCLENCKREPHFGGNYGKLARLAYAEFLLPLINDVGANGIERALDRLQSVEEGRSFEKIVSSVLDHLPPAVKNEIASPHRKKLVQFLKSRLGQIGICVFSEKSAHEDDEFERLSSAIESLEIDRFPSAVSREKPFDALQALRGWLWGLANTGHLEKRSACLLADSTRSFLNAPCLVEADRPYLRCLGAYADERMPSWSDYLSDALEYWAGEQDEAATAEKLLLENKFWVAREWARRWPEILLVSGKNLGAVMGEWERDFQGGIQKSLKRAHARLDMLPIDRKTYFGTELAALAGALNDGRLASAEKELGAVSKMLDEEIARFGDFDRRTALLEDIHELGGLVGPETAFSEMEKMREELWRNAAPRRAHLEPVNSLLSLPEMPASVRDGLEEVITKYSLPRLLPSAERAEWLRTLLEEATHPVRTMLCQSQLLRPEVTQTLYDLVDGVSHLIRKKDWVTDKSLVERVLSALAEKTKSINDIAVTKDICVWLKKELQEAGVDVEDSLSGNESDREGMAIAHTSLTAPDDDEADRESLREKVRRFISFSRGRIISDRNVETEHVEGLREKKETAISRWESLCARAGVNGREVNGVEGLARLSDESLVRLGLVLADPLEDTGATGEDSIDMVFRLLDSLYNLEFFLKETKRGGGVGASEYRKKALIWLTQAVNRSLPNNARLESLQLGHSGWVQGEDVLVAAGNWFRRVLSERARVADSRYRSPLLMWLWDAGSGEKFGPELRAWLLLGLSRGELYGALAFLLTVDPVRMEFRQAETTARILPEASTKEGWQRLESYMRWLRNECDAKPFQLFADQLLKAGAPVDERPASIRIVGPLEYQKKDQTWFAVLEVEPSIGDPPLDISLQLTRDSPVRFAGQKALTHTLQGPFLETTHIRVPLSASTSIRGKLRFIVRCRIKTVQAKEKEFIVTLNIDSPNDDPEFVKPSADEIARAFDRFPATPMRGAHYIPRDDDEKAIEELLFNSEVARSLWLTSPRRSGKTTMLYRILDEFSYKKGRDDLVLYFTLDQSFETERAFNQWIWKKLVRGRDNRELSEAIFGLEEIGEGLKFDNDCGDFLSGLADCLLAKSPMGTRVYYVIDEIDRFASMFLEGGASKKLADTIMWQFRQVIATNEHVGFLFAGSHAARRFFVLDPQAAFYNGIPELKLSPFSVDDQLHEQRTRQIVVPRRMEAAFRVSNNTIRHLLRVTNGIPYYMKLLAGATFASADHATLYPADVNIGLEKLLCGETGILEIDSLEAPGADELRTLFGESVEDIALLKGVLLASADLRKPASEFVINIGELWSDKSPLVNRAKLTRSIIEPAVKKVIDMGFLVTTKESEYKLAFAIPLLGESLLARFGIMWTEIERVLEGLRR